MSRTTCMSVALIVLALALGNAPGTYAAAEADAPPLRASAAKGVALTLDLAERLALTDQPLLLADSAAIRSARANAVADGQLPDPMLMTGIKDFPINGDPAFTIDRDDFTMFTVGVRQELPRRAKRRLRSERGDIEASAGEFALSVRERAIRRDTALAWLDVYHGERARESTRALVREYDTQVRALEIALRTNRAPQADVLAGRVELGLTGDRVRKLDRDVAEARARLARFLPNDADRPLPDLLPELPEPPALDLLLESIPSHPDFGRYDQLILAAANDVSQAREAYKPDTAVSLEYGYRQAFPDFVGVRLEMDLPLFPRQRQDRRMQASLAAADELAALRADTLRQYAAQARAAWVDWQSAREREREFQTQILPRASQRVAAARSAYESANAGFAEVLLARRAVIETELLALEQRVDIARAQVRLRYFAK